MLGNTLYKFDEASKALAKLSPGSKPILIDGFVNLLVRISFWRANPTHGKAKGVSPATPLPGCLVSLLQLLPAALAAEAPPPPAATPASQAAGGDDDKAAAAIQARIRGQQGRRASQAMRADGAASAPPEADTPAE